MSRFGWRGWTFAALAVVLVGAAAGYLVWLAVQGAGRAPAAAPGATTTAPDEAFLAFRRTGLDDAYGTVGVVPFDRPGDPPAATSLTCERIDMSRGGGVCLSVDRGVATKAQVLLLRPDMSVRHTLSTAGIPSRARVSQDGAWAATTTFVYGHSYADASFSTQTEIYDMAAGTSLGNLEDWGTTVDGEAFDAVDMNIWGVTFAPDGEGFYATVRAGGRFYLGRGDIADRSIVLTQDTVECPSLSPDGARLAFKSATSPGVWQVRVRTLADGSEVVIDQAGSVDDQIAWLDADRIAYGMSRDNGAITDVWAAPADGSAPATVFLPQAWSPAAVR